MLDLRAADDRESIEAAARAAFDAPIARGQARVRRFNGLPDEVFAPAEGSESIYTNELVDLDLPLLTHPGEERAVEGAAAEALGNPLLLRHPLERGVRVIAAHCASLGDSPDLDQPEKSRPTRRNFDLFARLMDTPRYEGLLVGEISAIAQANRGTLVGELLLRRDWHHRLLNGSDYPLPGVMPLFSLNALAAAGLLDAAHIPLLRELRECHPIWFDIALKSPLAKQGERFPARVFETRGFFARSPAGNTPPASDKA